MLSVILHTFWRCLPNAHKKKVSHIFHYFIQSPHKHKTRLYCIHKNKKHYQHTSYPTHLKLTVNNKDHCICWTAHPPQSMCCSVYQLVFFVFKLTDNACAPSMMDDRSANFGAAQYTVKYLNFTLDDKLLNWMGKMNKAVPLILNPLHLKGKMLCCMRHLNWTVLQP